MSLSKRILNLLYRNSARVFTIDEIIKFPVIASLTPDRRTVHKFLNRFLSQNIIERVRMDDGKTWAYRVLDPTWADAYIRGDASKPWLKVPPNPPETSFRVQNRHRLTYDVRLSKPDLGTLRDLGCLARNARTGGQLTLKRKQFTLSVNSRTGNGQAWLFTGWDAGLLKLFSPELHQSLAQQVSGREGREHISVPVEFVNRRIKVGGSDVVVAGSHYPLELDIQGPEKDMKKIQAVQLLADQIRFNRMMLGIEESLNHLEAGLTTLSGNLLKITEAQAKTAELLDRLVNGSKPEAQGEYQMVLPEKEDPAYG